MQAQDKHDHRRHPRIIAQLPVRISTIDPERDPWTGRPFFRASRETCLNVSRGGAYVSTGEPLTPGRRVLLEMTLPCGAPLEAIGRVAWQRRIITTSGTSNESGVGVEFLGAAAEQFSELENFIEALAQDEAEQDSDADDAPESDVASDAREETKENDPNS